MSGGFVALRDDAVDTISFEYVFIAYYSFVSKLARTLLGNVQDAEDVTQEVFLRVYKSLSSYDPQRGTLNAWLAKLTINASRTHRRRSLLHRLWRRDSSDDGDADVLQLVDHSLLATPEDHALQTELRKTVRGELHKLSPLFLLCQWLSPAISWKIIWYNGAIESSVVRWRVRP